MEFLQMSMLPVGVYFMLCYPMLWAKNQIAAMFLLIVGAMILSIFALMVL